MIPGGFPFVQCYAYYAQITSTTVSYSTTTMSYSRLMGAGSIVQQGGKQEVPFLRRCTWGTVWGSWQGCMRSTCS